MFRVRLETALLVLRSSGTKTAYILCGTLVVPCSSFDNISGTFRFVFSQILAPYDRSPSLGLDAERWEGEKVEMNSWP